MRSRDLVSPKALKLKGFKLSPCRQLHKVVYHKNTTHRHTMATDEELFVTTTTHANTTDLPARELDGTQYPTGVKLVIIMGSLMLGTTLMSLDTTIISVATPQISTQFHALDDVGWYGAAYLMTLTATTPIAANFYKYFNPKYVYLAFIAIFEGEPSVMDL